MAEEEFRVVRRGRRGGGRSTTHATGAHTVAELFRTQRPAGGPGAGAPDVVDGRRLAAALRALAPMGDALQACDVVAPVLVAAELNFPREGPASLLCIGLGCPAQSRAAQWQLAFLALLRQGMQAKGWAVEVAVHEPLLSATDRAILEKWLPSVAVEEVNVEAKLTIERPTVAFLPHCPSTLCCNLLRTNWSARLARLVVVGNSFATYRERAVTKEQQKKIACITQLLPYCTEIPLQLCKDSDVEAAFGDTSAHSFPLSALPPPDDRLWATPPPFPPPEHDVIGASSSKASPVDLPKSRNPADRIAHVHAIDQDQGGGIS